VIEITYIKNPFNYIGAKYKLLPQILPLFPDNIDTFVDLFGGSGEVGLNVKADRVVYNDKCEALVNILNNLDSVFVTEVEDTISKWGLSKLGKEEYIKFRAYYNENFSTMTGREKAISIYCLLTHAFNYQLAFNSKGEYNMPSGYNRSWFSPQLKDKLITYTDRISKIDIEFNNSDFHNLNLDTISKDSFFYADPPYLITVGAYERDYFCKWSEDYERELYNTLDILNQKGCKFALSNVMEHKGKTNTILKEWSKDYNVHHLNKEYANCNYQTNDREIKTSDEVLITNYIKDGD
jgi:DNA adenine methylase Dam